MVFVVILACAMATGRSRRAPASPPLRPDVARTVTLLVKTIAQQLLENDMMTSNPAPRAAPVGPVCCG